jgi:aromatic ring-opening dioxygenase catalytic subunit (LigB family)
MGSSNKAIKKEREKKIDYICRLIVYFSTDYLSAGQWYNRKKRMSQFHCFYGFLSTVYMRHE